MKQLNLRKLVCVSLFIGCTIQLQAQTPQPFVTTWEVADDGNTATTDDLSITIPTRNSLTYSYTVDWGDGTTDTTTYTGDTTHTYSAAGTYTVAISGDFPAIYFNDLIVKAGDNSLKIKTIKSWGTQRWRTLRSAFAGCQNLTTIEDGAGVPDLTMVTSMHNAFYGATRFNGNLSSWDVSNVTSMWSTFYKATSFNSDLSSWNVSNVNNMGRTFLGTTSFNSDLSRWDVFNVATMEAIFLGATSFNQNLSNWDVSNVVNMQDTFRNATSFNSDLSSWNVSKVTSMWSTFEDATIFNQDLSTWNVSNVTDMTDTFAGATSFNEDISTWDVSNVINMKSAFRGATSFNGNISSWDVSNVTNMFITFEGATSFNQDLSSWNVSNVTLMSAAFRDATSFNQDISSWDVSNVIYMSGAFSGATSFSAENYDALLKDWSSLPTLQNDVEFGAPPTTYCAGKAGRDLLTGTYNWDIRGDNGLDCTAVTSTDEEFLSNTKIYPNPTNGKINIESSFSIDKLELYNVLGAKLFSVSKTNVLDLAGLRQGIYILKVFSADRVISKKIIKD